MFSRTAFSLAAVLACALGVTLAACSSSPATTSTGGSTSSGSPASSGGSSGGSGTAAADQARQQVAAAFWALDGSLGTARSTGGLGRFAACSSADSLAYAIEAGVLPAKGAKPTMAAFATSVLHDFATAGWKLAQSGTGTYKIQRDGLSVQLGVFTNSNGTSGSFTVQSGCVSVGSDAQKIAADYSSGQDDSYPQGDVSAKPVPTTFPTPGA